MKHLKLLFLFLIIPFLNSCLTSKEIRYVQPNENLEVNEFGYVPYNIPEYRVNINDVLQVSILTTPKGDAAQFYGNIATEEQTSTTDRNFNLKGFKVDQNGDVHIMGIGYVKAVGRTTDEIAAEIQEKVNENFLPGKSEVRVNLDGITYFILSDLEGKTLKQTAQVNTLNVLEMLAENGGLDRRIDRKHIRMYRKFPEGMKFAIIDITRADFMNSPYFYVQNGDMFLLETKRKSLNGFGNEPIKTLTTGISLFTTALSVYLLFSRF